MAEKRLEKVVSLEQEAVEFHRKVGRGMVAKAAQNLTELPENGLDAAQVARLARDGVQIERQALGLETNTGTKIEITAVTTLIAEIRAVLQVELADDPERLQRIADRLARMASAPAPCEPGSGQ